MKEHVNPVIRIQALGWIESVSRRLTLFFFNKTKVVPVTLSYFCFYLQIGTLYKIRYFLVFLFS
jgi:hypothetical protein